MAYWFVAFLFAAHFGTAVEKIGRGSQIALKSEAILSYPMPIKALGQQGTQSFDRFLTVRNIFETLNYSVRSLLLCNPTHSNPNDTRIVRAMDTGQGFNLTNNTLLRHSAILDHMLTAYLLPNYDDPIDRRFGVYTCEVTVDNVTTRVTTFKLLSSGDADVSASPNRYLRASREDRVELKVNAVSQPVALRWKLNGHDRPEWENLTEVVIDSATSNDAGVYECFYDGRRELGRHALMRLTVQECPLNKWGELCSHDCPRCYNGGVCNAELGVCICPPGFDGDNCEKACGPNYFGEGCKKQCDSDDTAPPEDGCAAFLFCLPGPYGCSCGAGFLGQYCFDDCEKGFMALAAFNPATAKKVQKHATRLLAIVTVVVRLGGQENRAKFPSVILGFTVLAAFNPATAKKVQKHATSLLANVTVVVRMGGQENRAKFPLALSSRSTQSKCSLLLCFAHVTCTSGFYANLYHIASLGLRFLTSKQKKHVICKCIFYNYVKCLEEKKKKCGPIVSIFFYSKENNRFSK